MTKPDNHSDRNPDSPLSTQKGAGEQHNVNPDGLERVKKMRREPELEEYVEGILANDRTLLSRAITLVESARPEHQKLSEEIIERCLPHAGQSVRIGITGVPGVGKSTFIETLGQHLLSNGRRLAVLAIDPSSTRSGGSILGDKTRMETLSNHSDAYIRPSPTAGSLGGVARKTRETIYLCEAAGYDTIFIETVGVGQSETAVDSMVDFFLLLMLAGAGDELQGIKRGIIEMADLLAINKIDESDEGQVRRAVREYQNALHLYPEPESGWSPRVTTCSAATGSGIEEIWALVEQYLEQARGNGYFGQKRNRQARNWMYDTIRERLMERFYRDAQVRQKLEEMERQVLNGETSSFRAARLLLDLFHE